MCIFSFEGTFGPFLLSDMVLQGCEPLPQFLLGKDHLTVLFIPT